MKDGKRPVLRVMEGGGAGEVSAAQVLREGARLFADYITQRLGEVAETDPERGRAEAAAERLRSLAG